MATTKSQSTVSKTRPRTTVQKAKSKSVAQQSRTSSILGNRSIQALLFVAVFGLVGGWLVFQSHAATIPEGVCTLKSGGGNWGATADADFINTGGNNGAKLSSFAVTVPTGSDLLWAGSNRSTLFVEAWVLGSNGKPVATTPQPLYLSYTSIYNKNGQHTYQAAVPSNLTHVYSMAMTIKVKDSSGTVRGCTTNYFGPYPR